MTPSSRSIRSSPGCSDHNSLERCSTVLADVVGAGVGIEGEQRRQAVAQRRPQARLAVRRARRLEDDRLVGQAGDDVVGEARLAAARLADDRNDTAVAGAHERDRRLEQRQLVEAADERDVAAHRAGAGGRGAGDDPRLLGLLAAADLRDAERLAGDRRRTQRLGRFADQHAARRCQRLESRRRVDDIAHRGVVGPGDRADEDFAGVDADAHLDVDRRSRRCPRRRSATRRASVSCIRRAARTARSASSSWATGAPNRAMMASPRTLSTRPPNASISATSGWKYDSTRRVTASGIEVLGERGVADEVGEQHRDDPPFLDRDRRILRRRAARRTEPGT